MQYTPGRNQVKREKAKKAPKSRLRDARQRLRMIRNGQVSVEWVLFTDDILSQTSTENEARIIWNNECYPRAFFHVGEEVKTQAEAIRDWCVSGWSLEVSKDWWTKNRWRWTVCSPEVVDKSRPDWSIFQKQRMEVMMKRRGFPTRAADEPASKARRREGP
jgi:hypothetical protein